MIFDSFSDIIKHTYGLGLVDMVKVTGTENDVSVAAIDQGRTVVITGTLEDSIPNLTDTIGLSRISVLSGYLNFTPFANKDADIQIITQERKDKIVPSELSFNSGQGHTANYRFMTSEIAEEQIKIPPFKGATFQVEVQPTKSAIKDLVSMSSILSSFENTFAVKTENGCLKFMIGSGGTDRSSLVFATGIETSLKHTWSFPLSQVLSILKLYDTSKSVTMYFSDMAALKIEVVSQLGKYTYILPAKSN
jgi:hypothetical protein